MSSPSTSSQRRRRSEIESEEEEDAFERSGSSKRARTSGYDTSSPASSVNDSRNPQSNFQNDEDNDDDASDEDDVTPSEFQPGAIVRVKLTNFVTYENAEFFPGPNLNMVIGPNGTGKSSLVCAICLGLGWGPQHLGRASQVGEFVKHNMSDANVEIELQKRQNEPRNHVVRLRIIRDGNAREWWLDGRKTSLKAVQSLTRSLSIQIDNLCQFLPQDKVSEFAGLSPVDLLLQTQRAAAPEEMLEWHDTLKKLRKEQKALEIMQESDKGQLQTDEQRQQNLQAEMERLKERIQVQEKIALLEKTVPFVEYQNAKDQHQVFKERKKEAQRRFKELSQRIAPILQSITEKEQYRDQIKGVVNQREKALKLAEREADARIASIEELEENIKQMDQEEEALGREEGKRKQDLQGIQRKITDLKARLNDAPIEFNPAEWNERIREKEHEVRDIEVEMSELKSQEARLIEDGRASRDNLDLAKRELSSLDTQEGRQMNKLESFSKETATAWKWVQDNMDRFEKEIYGPPMVSCSIKDHRYTNAVESLLRKNDFLVITAQTAADFKKLSDELHGNLGLSEVTIRSSDGTLFGSPMSAQELQQLGMDGWAVDFVDGPVPVLSMLCDSVKLDRSAVSLRDISDNQYNTLVEKGLTRFISGSYAYSVSRRREYGPSAVSTSTRSLQPAKYWTDHPVDTSARREIEDRIRTFETNFNSLKQQVLPVRIKLKSLATQREELQSEIKQIKEEKADVQKAHGTQKALPDKIRREEESLQAKKEVGAENLNRLKQLHNQQDLLVLRKVKHALAYKEQISLIRKSHDGLLEAKIMLIEAESDVSGLTEQNQNVVQQRDEEQLRVQTIEQEAQAVRNVAARAMDICKDILADPANEHLNEQLTKYPEGTTVESLQNEIIAEESKLQFIHANNPNAIQQYERREIEVHQLRNKIADTESKLEKISRSITKIMGRWEPELDKLIAEISDAFSYNFEQIGCAGEVSVHKDEDFDLWSIQIKVKFRENETLQVLDQHRQSGGERSVSTIFYLMSLQSLARAPFRVVDEINQGMDPRNERMVHERMVEIACKEHTSQYFLITPKLLTGLRYDKRMKVLCIASGEYMPENYKTLDVSKIIGIQTAIMAAG